MRKLVLFLVAVSGCTAITDFAGYRFSDTDLSASGDAGERSDGGDAGASVDLKSVDASNPDLMPPVCPGNTECCASVPCAGGGCCISGTCFASGADAMSGMVCVDGTVRPCGMATQACCGEGVCHNQGCCVGGTCVANSSGVMLNTCGGTLGTCMGGGCQGIATSCGAQGDSCCPGGGNAGDFCTETGTVCVSAMCQQCALLPGGQFCCPGNWCPTGGCCDGSNQQCISSGDSCSSGQGQCSNGGCKGGQCGKLKQPCCSSAGCTDALTRCSPTNTCDACGGLDQRCCANQFCSEGFVCDSTDSCRRCGNNTQPCCPGGQCASTLRCNNSGVCL